MNRTEYIKYLEKYEKGFAGEEFDEERKERRELCEAVQSFDKKRLQNATEDDLVGDIAKDANLTRKTVVDILDGCKDRLYMSTSEIEDYLDNAELVSKMKFAVVVILLKKLGFHNCGFKNDWKHLSILE